MDADDLVTQLEAAPEGEILGVVGAGGVAGVGGGPSPDNVQWKVQFSLSSWKPADGKLRESEMAMWKEVPEADVAVFMGIIRPYDIVRLRARWLEGDGFDSTEAILIEFIGKEDSDSELNSYAERLQEAVTFTDFQFGLFTLNRRVDWYEAVVDWCGSRIQLTIPECSQDELEKMLDVARQLWSDVEGWQRRFANCAIDELLELKNGVWIQEGEARVSREEFASRLIPASISVEEDGAFEIWYDDGDLFWGHSIVVTGNLKDGPIDAGIHG